LNEVAEQIKKLGGTPLVVRCDVCSDEDIKHLIQEAYTTFGSIDVLIPTAGISAGGLFEHFTEEVTRKIVDVFLFFFCFVFSLFLAFFFR